MAGHLVNATTKPKMKFRRAGGGYCVDSESHLHQATNDRSNQYESLEKIIYTLEWKESGKCDLF